MIDGDAGLAEIGIAVMGHAPARHVGNPGLGPGASARSRDSVHPGTAWNVGDELLGLARWT
jgi:hypothetical protein